eukprot:15186502-Ditylum_brightwellii.AAC.1
MLLSTIDESVDDALDSFGSNMLLVLLLVLFVEDHQVPYFEGHVLLCLQFFGAFGHVSLNFLHHLKKFVWDCGRCRLVI